MSEAKDETTISLKARRERGLDDLAAVIAELWGPRCSRHEGQCHCCVAWTVFDVMEKLTDSAIIEDDGQTMEKQGD